MGGIDKDQALFEQLTLSDIYTMIITNNSDKVRIP